MRRTSTRNYRQWGYIGFNGGGSDTSRVPHGEPYAGNLHVRFDEGAGVPDNKGRPALLYTPWQHDWEYYGVRYAEQNSAELAE